MIRRSMKPHIMSSVMANGGTIGEIQRLEGGAIMELPGQVELRPSDYNGFQRPKVTVGATREVGMCRGAQRWRKLLGDN